MGKSTAYYEQPTLWDRPLTQQEEERLHLVRAVWPEGVRTVLDVGCGNGALGNYLPEDAEVVGIDFSREALRHFRRRKILGLATCLPFSDEKFDLVICADTLEHLLPGEFERCTAELKRVARRFLLIISPQDEDLLANSTKCRYCGTLFHVNWHMRSLTKETIVHSFADLFSLRYFTFFGEKWLRRHPLVTKLHHSLAGRLSYWEDAVCPLCNVRQGDLPAPADDEKQVALLDDLEEICPLPSNACRENRCEILLLFERQGEQPENKADRPRQASAIILQPADGGEVTGRLIFRHRGTIEMDSPLCASPVTCFDPERAYLIVNEQMDWGRPYLLDDRWVRNYEDCGGKDAHAVCVFPRDVRGLRALIVSYKDTTAEPIHLQAYDPQQGYIQVGTLKGAGAGRWRKAIFPLPVHVRPGREGLIIHFVADGLSHPRDPHPIGSVEVLGATTQSIALALHPTVEDGKQSWVADYPHATCFSDREPVLKVNQPCLAKLGLPERERYLLGEGEELPIPMWLHEVLQGRAGYEVQERLEAEVARLRGELAEVRVMQEQEVARLQEALAASHQEAEASRLQLEQRGVEVSQIQAALRAAQAAQEQEVARLQEALAASHQEAEAARLQVEQQGVELSQIQAAQE
ncbi:MAG: methyltransferase domain-containing protein, partial [Candidatus Methylomirabilis oxyfera]|nr:methyltransferase domain-containing protein [Candidatus Methylomirabilis oxyfera]